MVFDISRRDFIRVNVTASFLALTQKNVALQLTAHERDTLLAIARTIFPHTGVDEWPYLRAVDRLRRRCELNSDLLDVIAGGITELEWTCGQQFTRMPTASRVAALASIRSTTFYNVAYSELLEGLYGPFDMWSLFTSSAPSPV